MQNTYALSHCVGGTLRIPKYSAMLWISIGPANSLKEKVSHMGHTHSFFCMKRYRASFFIMLHVKKKQNFSTKDIWEYLNKNILTPEKACYNHLFQNFSSDSKCPYRLHKFDRSSIKSDLQGIHKSWSCVK